MKRRLVVLVALLFLSISSVKAVELSNYLPGGKNFLDSNNFQVVDNTLSSINDFKVEGYTFYTLSMPGTDMLGETITVLIGGNELYINGDISLDPLCTVDQDQSICTFLTSETETALSVTITGDLVSSYYNAYDMDYFQLEFGEFATSYEAYIPPLTDTSSPEVEGAGAYIMSYTNLASIDTIIDQHIVVYDEVDGDLSNDVIIQSDEYTTNEGIVGEYEVLMSVSDSSLNTTFFTLTIMVKDEIAPVIIGPTSIDIEVFDQRSLQTILEDTYLFNDEYDGALLPVVTLDNYTINKDTLGTYEVSFEVVDSSLNTSSRTIDIVVVDTKKPTVSGNQTITSYLSDPITLGGIINGLTFDDNYTDMSTEPKVIMYEDYTSNYLIPGIYIASIQVRDSSNNILNVNIDIEVIDDVSPVITGPTTYSYSYTDVPTLAEVLALYSFSDNVDSFTVDDVIITVDTFSARSNDIGSYQIVFELHDSNGNNISHTLTIEGIDDVPPVIYIDQYIVSLDINSTFTENDALRLLLNNNELLVDEYEITTLKNEYKGNENSKGTYLYTLQFKNSKGEIFEKDFHIKVEPENTVNSDLLTRNIIIYISVLIIVGFVYYKKH